MVKAAKCGGGKPLKTKKAKPKLTDTERHKRFVEMAREVGADESREAFDAAFDSVVDLKTLVPKKQ